MDTEKPSWLLGCLAGLALFQRPKAQHLASCGRLLVAVGCLSAAEAPVRRPIRTTVEIRARATSGSLHSLETMGVLSPQLSRTQPTQPLTRGRTETGEAVSDRTRGTPNWCVCMLCLVAAGAPHSFAASRCWWQRGGRGGGGDRAMKSRSLRHDVVNLEL